MNDHLATLAESIGSRFGERLRRIESRCGELTYEVACACVGRTCRVLRDEAAFAFEQLVDLTGVDYLDYGRDEWNTESATGTGFSRGVEQAGRAVPEDARRFAVAYHLLSVATNRRLRLRAYCEAGEPPMLDSVIEVWKSGGWDERGGVGSVGVG